MKVGKIVSLITLISACCIFCLWKNTNESIHRRNNFIRIFPPHPTSFTRAKDIKYNTFYFAGFSPSQLYLANELVPFRLLVVNNPLDAAMPTELPLLFPDTIRWVAPVIEIDSPHFYVRDGILPGIYNGLIGSRGLRRMKYDSAFFVESVAIDKHSVAIRSASRNNIHILGKESEILPQPVFNRSLLTKQIDGLFCTDGMLHYDKDIQKLIYLYYYRNEFLVMDTSLNLIYTGKTIDTTHIAKIKVALTDAGQTAVLVGPPAIVNKASCVSGNFLFVWSLLRARNETGDLFEKYPVIDVYSLTRGEYAFSFYLISDFGTKVKTFRVYRNKLFALYDHELIMYDLAGQYFKSDQ